MNYYNNGFKLAVLKCLSENSFEIFYKQIESKNLFNFKNLFMEYCDNLKDFEILYVNDDLKELCIEFQIYVDFEDDYETYEFEVVIDYNLLEIYYEEFLNG